MIYLRLTLTRVTIDDDPHPAATRDIKDGAQAHPHRHEGEAGTPLHAARLGHAPTLVIEHMPVAVLPPPPRRRSMLAGLLRGIAKRIEGEVPAKQTD